MQSHELIVPGRLEELLGGALPETESEAHVQGLARELRASTLSVSAPLRGRVESLGTAPRRSRFWRRTRVVLVLAAVGAALAAAAGTGLVSSGDRTGSLSTVGGGSTVGGEETTHGVPNDVTTNLSGESLRAMKPPTPVFAPSPIPSGRAQDVDMWITLRVKDADQLSESSQEAMKITRELGGVVGSSNVATEGSRGQARLSLRVPTGRVDDALFRLSELGTVTGQRVATVDLQAPLDRVLARVEHLRSAIRIAKARLASGLLSDQEQLQMRIRLERLRSQLSAVTRTRTALEREASMADLTLTIGTPTGPVARTSESGIGGAAHKAVDVLRGAGSVAVFLAILLSPLLVLLLLAWMALRARGRRIERELLDESRPGVASPQRR
jgi:Domain of unknown function (DUF4349)